MNIFELIIIKTISIMAGLKYFNTLLQNKYIIIYSNNFQQIKQYIYCKRNFFIKRNFLLHLKV